MNRLLKVEGAGNDFVLGIGSWAERLAGDAELVRRLCHRRRGIGADGALALRRTADNVLDLLYRNADASEALFCANATRCAARVGVELLGVSSPVRVRTGWATITATVAGERVALELPPPAEPEATITLAAGGGRWSGQRLVVGVPHLVIEVADELGELDLDGLGPLLGHHAEFGPRGCNVSWMACRGADEIAIRTWELGVEAETMACGSAVVAACLLRMAETGRSRLTCRTQSGTELLTEAIGDDAPLCATRLSGPARLVAEIEPSPELLG